MPVVLGTRRLSTPEELLAKHTLKTDTCWIWQGTKKANGYGVVKVGGRQGKKWYAHRLSYVTLVEPIGEGLELDHLCRNRICVNPNHLEPVTRQVNVIRGAGPAILGKLNRSKTHCKRGHMYTEENTYKRRAGGRACRACQKLYRKTPERLRRVED